MRTQQIFGMFGGGCARTSDEECEEGVIICEPGEGAWKPRLIRVSCSTNWLAPYRWQKKFALRRAS